MVSCGFQHPPQLKALLSEWHGKHDCPVVIMEKSLYGHPDSGTQWERHYDDQLKSIGFSPVPNWDLLYYGSKTKLLLSVHVDDFKLAAPNNNIAKGWGLIRKGIHMDDPYTNATVSRLHPQPVRGKPRRRGLRVWN